MNRTKNLKRRKERKEVANNYATIEDIENLFRSLDPDEESKAYNLLEIVSDSLRYEAIKVGKDLDRMIEKTPLLANIAKSVTVDVVARALMTSTNQEPTTQYSQSALGYSVSGTFLVPGGGLFIKKSELARLGIRSQSMKLIQLYDYDQGNTGSSDQ